MKHEFWVNLHGVEFIGASTNTENVTLEKKLHKCMVKSLTNQNSHKKTGHTLHHWWHTLWLEVISRENLVRVRHAEKEFRLDNWRVASLTFVWDVGAKTCRHFSFLSSFLLDLRLLNSYSCIHPNKECRWLKRIVFCDANPKRWSFRYEFVSHSSWMCSASWFEQIFSERWFNSFHSHIFFICFDFRFWLLPLEPTNQVVCVWIRSLTQAPTLSSPSSSRNWRRVPNARSNYASTCANSFSVLLRRRKNSSAFYFSVLFPTDPFKFHQLFCSIPWTNCNSSQFLVSDHPYFCFDFLNISEMMYACRWIANCRRRRSHAAAKSNRCAACFMLNIHVEHFHRNQW